ncbi:MAG: DNA-binding transcriptional regulator YhcF (GntR family) [Kiritimatiellia bacterium]|jgi:DNA-binding transcriptional regulator YhcF (GntR family)
MIDTASESGFQDVVHDAARKLTDDLQWRGLVPGERYISAEEAGKFLGVSMATADRAMRLLTEQKVLVRQRGRGTFVGQGIIQETTDVRSIQIMMPRLKQSLGLSIEDMIRGIHNVFPDVPVAINVFPVDDPMPVFRRVLDEGKASGRLMGMGMILVPRIIQEMVAAQGVPAVLLGTPYAGIEGLVSIDIDYRQLGNLTAQYLLDRDHRQFALLLRERVAAGDTTLLQGFSETLGAAGISCDALNVRHCVVEEKALSGTVKSLLTQDPRPTALFGYPYPAVADWIQTVGSELGLEEGVDFEFVCELGAANPSPARCPVRCCVSPDKVGERFGRLLARVARGEEVASAHTLLPVELKG